MFQLSHGQHTLSYELCLSKSNSEAIGHGTGLFAII